MIYGHKIIGIIPARCGSKRLPGKNIAMCAGKPLIVCTIEEARRSKLIDHLVCSTDSDEIGAICDQYHCKWMRRPYAFSGDKATSEDVVRHVLKFNPTFAIAVLLQPTSPLRTAEDIDAAILRHPCMTVREDGTLNGAVYVWRKEDLYRFNFYSMPKERSIDIDTLEDLKEAERLLYARLPAC
jgi:CMP-N-acetylneuraminic acid synthetase